MSNEIYTSWIVSQAPDVTNLQALAAGDIWQSDNITTGPIAGKQHMLCRISYKIVLNAAAAGGDKITFYIFHGDEHFPTDEIWDGGVGETEGQITTAAAKAAIRDNVPAAKVVTLTAAVGTTQQGSFEVKNLSPEWIIGVDLTGVTPLAASGSLIHYRYFDTQGQV